LRVVFPDGTAVEACGLRDRRAEASDRDFGLYMDPRWAPTWPAELIEWEDFGLPADPEHAAEQIRAAFERARRGERVEVGCAGGLGRTGTVLACMAVLAGVPSSGAVAWVRANYEDRAVETAEQEAFVHAFAR
jgi:Protein-tyrosine phosphatase